jgi:hypothetical protein
MEFLVFYLKQLADILHRILMLLTSIVPSNEFLSDVAALEGVLIGVAIPISLQVVIWTADRYKDHEIAKFFTDEPLYRWQYFLLLSNIGIAILFRFLDISNLLLLAIVFLWLIINIFIFYRFIRLVERYATQTDQLLLQKLKRYVEDILKK